MRRNDDLIRDLLLALEARPMGASSIHLIPYDDSFFTSLGNYTEAEIIYHLRQIWMSGYIDAGGSNSNLMGMTGVSFRGLTPLGHDFADSVRDPEIWRKTKEGALSVGGLTLDLMKDLAKGFIKKQVSAHTGIEL